MREQKAVETNGTYLRSLPRNIEAEQVVLGSAILEPEGAVPILLEQLRPEYFYRQAHRVICKRQVDALT
jgi:replicative DNA helicase